MGVVEVDLVDLKVSQEGRIIYNYITNIITK